jgi:hypothetical protein
MSEGMSYPNSHMSPGAGAPTPQPEYHEDPTRGAVSGADSEHLTYPSLSHQGLVTVELPLSNPSGVAQVEKVLARNIGHHVAEQVERGFRVSTAEASNTLAWYTGCLKANELLDAKSIAQLEKLSRGLAGSSDPGEFYLTNVEPFLVGLRPGRR